KKREEFYPLEYILKKTSFYSREFYTDERVLIPRPETEILIDKVVYIAENLDDLTIAEVGTGSGIISVMLAILLPNTKIIATDISADALEVAKINAKKYDVNERIKFVKSDLLDGVSEKIDIIVSNPPYIKKYEKLEKNLSYEPNIALFGGVKGDEILKKIIDESIKRKVRYLACEMGYDQREKITNYLSSYGLKARFYQDLSQIDRGFVVY
ncbi:MAG: peptide chain release factor N(5)-glutamine methyltransferase, partial [Campylobacteraceae bacterium]|nr:peptide chain release factor N(5)-glutamine methyltransferase [Campylobacteraceae bacterium]